MVIANPLMPPRLGVGTIPSVVPFTMRENRSQMGLVEGMRHWIDKDLVPFINENIDSLSNTWVEQANKLIDDFEMITTGLVATVNEAVEGIGTSVEDAQAAQAAAEAARDLAAQYASDAEEIQDAAITTIVSDDASATRAAMDVLYASFASVTGINGVLNGRLSAATLDGRFSDLDNEKADITFVQEGFTPVNTLGVRVNTLTGTLADIQGAIDLAAASKVPVYISGVYEINAPIVLPSNVRIVGVGAVSIKQTSPLTAHFTGNAIVNVDINGLTLIGYANDYTNSDAVYGATAFKFTGDNGRISIDNCVFDSVVGAAVFVTTSATKHLSVRNCIAKGAGLSVIGVGTFSAGIVVQDGIQDVILDNNDISEYGQGIAIGHGSKRVTITNNRIHHTSEHGGYFATSDSYIITGNHFYNTAVLGFKIQNGKAGYTCRNAIISGNILDATGSNAIMIVNAIDATNFIKNVIITDNVVTACGDTGIRVSNTENAKVVNNIVNGARFGIRVFASKLVQVVSNTIMETERTGLLIDNTSLVKVSLNTMLNLGILGPEKVAIIVSGIVDGLTIEENNIDYDKAAHSDGLLFGAGNYTRIRILNNYFRGANWGMRTAAAAAAIIDWRNNRAIGGVGTIDGAPTIVPTLPNIALGTLAVAEAEVNKIKQILRDQQDAR